MKMIDDGYTSLTDLPNTEQIVRDITNKVSGNIKTWKKQDNKNQKNINLIALYSFQ